MPDRRPWRGKVVSSLFAKLEFVGRLDDRVLGDVAGSALASRRHAFQESSNLSAERGDI